MAAFSKTFISIADLYLAYRKAKVEAFYENTHFHAIAFTEYEQKLHANLQRLLTTLLDRSASWTSELSFLGGFAYAPKSLAEPGSPDDKEIFFRALDPVEDWQRRFKKNRKKRVDANFRLVILPTVDFQIISALWILKVGHLLDDRLDSRICYANRLRRHHVQHALDSDNVHGDINKDCLGLFAPYFSAYRNWRETGLNKMRESLEANERIIAVTMDLRSFYHQVNPDFLLRKKFLKAINVKLNSDEIRFTQHLLKATWNWYKKTPDYRKRPQGAIPVGLSASKIIANVLLFKFDQFMSTQLRPIHYGRYVDDVFLVIKQPSQIFSGEEFMKNLATSSRGLLRLKRSPGAESVLEVHLNYAAGSELIFAGEKQKIFILSSDHGLDLVQKISEQIRRQSSEHRLLAYPPATGAEMASHALLATPDAALEADALRKADVVSVRRFGFASLLGDMESYAKDLQRSDEQSWCKLRHEFYELVHRHLLTPRGIFDFVNYLPRIFGLMIACRDFNHANKFLDSFVAVLNLISKTTTATKNKTKYYRCLSYYAGSLAQATVQASTVIKFIFDQKFIRILRRIQELDKTLKLPKGVVAARALSSQLLNADWGRRPYKDYWYYSQLEDARGPKVPKSISIKRLLRLGAIRSFRKTADLRVPFWPALAFPTRALTVPEISLYAPQLLSTEERFRAAIMALRGARVPPSIGLRLGFAGGEGQTPRYCVIPKPQKGKLRIAITNLETTDSQWLKALKRHHDMSLKRYQLIRGLVNRILQEKPRPNYVVFPECSIPRRWALSIATKLAENNISLLAGLEYYTKRNEIRNDCLISLTTRWPGYAKNILIMQPKLVPSHDERIKLSRYVGKKLYKPYGLEKVPPIFAHGDFYFGVLLCSDLTNIENRKYFQGNVDALFVLEWNPDTATFGFLVESAAHDVHAFILQINNRMYGDSRVRVPYKIRYKRDLVRVKGGTSDYYVMADIDYRPLRRFQKRPITPTSGEFKPTPIGFRISKLRSKVS